MGCMNPHMDRRRRKFPHSSLKPQQRHCSKSKLKVDSIAGKNIANPVAMILCVALMFRYSLDMEREAQQIEEAVRTVLDSGIRTPDLGGKAGTTEVGDAIVAVLRGQKL